MAVLAAGSAALRSSCWLGSQHPCRGSCEAVHGLECAIRAVAQDRVSLSEQAQERLTTVDTWALRDLEVRSGGNLAPCATLLTKRKGSSPHVLPQLLDEHHKFDVIYVDGSHVADDVLTDGIAAPAPLKQSGALILDDFCGHATHVCGRTVHGRSMFLELPSRSLFGK
jgi:Methyltransferase domain